MTSGGLQLLLKENQQVLIGDECIIIEVMECKTGSTRLRVKAPQDFEIKWTKTMATLNKE